MGHQILAVGEVLWDLLPNGKQSGGHTGRLTCQSSSLGADARLVTRVGDDALGREVRQQFRLLGLPTETVQINPEFPTGTADVAVPRAVSPASPSTNTSRGIGSSRREFTGHGRQGGCRLLRQPLPAERAGTHCDPLARLGHSPRGVAPLRCESSTPLR